jgi:hypothetical protein
MKIFPEVLVFFERENDRDLVAVLINNLLFNSGHGKS